MQPMRPSPAAQNGNRGPSSDIGPGENPVQTGKRSPLKFSGRGLAFVVLALSLVVTFVAFDFARQEAAQHLDRRFSSAVKEISDDIRERTALVEESLHASRAFVLATQKIGREEWRMFQNNQEIETYHPGTFGIGLAPEIRREDADAYVRAIRREDQNDYKIWPSGEGAAYAPIRFTASHNGDTRALGLDLYSDPRRKSAMEKARDTGKPALSGVVTLVKAGEMEGRESIILFLPVYKQALAKDASVDQRRAAFVSYVYCPIIIEEFWRGLAAKASKMQIAVRITDANGDTMLPATAPMPAQGHALSVSTSKDVYGQTWQFEFWALPGFADTGLNSKAAGIAAAGLVISFLLFAFTWVLTSTKLRAEAIARNMTRALRDSEGRMRNVVEQSPDAMIVHQDGKIVFANKAMGRLMRVDDAAALIGRSPVSLVHPERQKISERRIQDLYEKKTLPLSEQIYVRADGTAVDVEVAAVGFELEARPAALATVRDVSERRKHEAENERLRRLYTALSQINQAIVWMPTRDKLLQRICDVLVEHGGFRMAWIGWHEAKSHTLVPVAQAGDEGGYLQSVTINTDDRPEGQGPAGRAFREGGRSISNDFLGDSATLPWRTEAELRGFRAAAAFPIRLKGEVSGTLAVYATEAGFFQDKEIALLVEAAIDLSFALDNFVREEERRSAQAIAKRLAAIVESTDDAVIAKTVEGIITDWNPAAERLIGYAANEIVGQPIGVLVPPDRAEEEAQILTRIRQGEHIRNFETERVRKNGEAFPVSVTISPIREPAGAIAGATKIIGASTIMRDISERKRAEASAQAQRLFSDTLIESLPGIFYLYDEQRRLLRWNRNFATVSGYSMEEIARMHPLDFFTAEDHARVDQAISEVFENGESSLEAAFLSKDGGVTLHFFTGIRLFFEGSVCLIGVGIDISERKRAEDELKANEQHQRQLARQVESQRARLVEAQAVAKIGSWETELQDMRVTWSDETYRIFETDPASFQPTHAGVLARVHPEDRARVDAAFAASLGETAPSAIEHRIVTPAGRIKIVEERWQIFRDPQGQPLRAVGTCQDITQRKEAEQALQEYARRLQAVSRQVLEVQENERRLLARELHDTVGQELTAISLNLTMVRLALPPDLTVTVGNRLDDSQKLLEDTTQHLRSVMVELRPPAIDEFGLVAALKEHARRVADRSGFELVLRAVEPKPRFPLATAMALFRIVQEALNNTVKHAQASTITIELHEGPDLITLTVADDGKGFDTTRKPLIGVYGMGMTTMRERAETIGAQLRIDSAIGKGTRVKIEIARTSPPAGPKRPGE